MASPELTPQTVPSKSEQIYFNPPGIKSQLSVGSLDLVYILSDEFTPHTYPLV